MQTIIYIYALVDPRDKRVRYIGKTNDVTRRLEQHFYSMDGNSPHKERWIASLKSKGLKPIIEVVEECTEENWIEREQFWIAKYREKYNDLTNLTEGGEGGGENFRAAAVRRFAKKHSVPIKKCFCCGAITVSKFDLCASCLRQTDPDFENADWYKFINADYYKNIRREKVGESRFVSIDD